MKTEHTETPWEVRPCLPLHTIWHTAEPDALDIMIGRTCYAPTSEANADHIVKCVNAHDGLVRLVHRVSSIVDNHKHNLWVRGLGKEARAILTTLNAEQQP